MSNGVENHRAQKFAFLCGFVFRHILQSLGALKRDGRKPPDCLQGLRREFDTPQK